MMVNKKKLHNLVFVGGIKEIFFKANSSEIIYATEYKYQAVNDYLGYYV